jgi:hypothetical protein
VEAVVRTVCINLVVYFRAYAVGLVACGQPVRGELDVLVRFVTVAASVDRDG